MTKTKLYTAIILGVATIMVFSSIAPVLVADAGAPQLPGLRLCTNCGTPPTGQVFVGVDTSRPSDGVCDIGPFLISEAAARGIFGTCFFPTI